MSDHTTLERPAPIVPIAPNAPIDPRIRARRIEVQRDAGRRRLQRLVDVGVVAVVAGAFLAALWSPLLDVDAVHVTGAEHATVEAVVEQAGIVPGDRLVGVDLQDAGERVAALPWVEQAALHRQLDGTVSIAVTERAPVARVGAGEAASLVDPTGRVLGPAAEAPDLPPVVELQGLDVVPAGRYLADSSAGALALAARVAVAAPGQVATLDVTDLTGTLVQGGRVRFAEGHLDDTITDLRTVLSQVDLTCLALLDLRLANHPVLTREEGCS